jgi:hypothetical protein
MTLQRRLLVRFRRWTMILALAGAAYLGLRFDLVTLPPDGCSPVTRFEPGDRLVIDRHPNGLGPGDAVLVRAPDGVLHLVVVEAIREAGGELWCSADCERCDAFDSGAAVWLEPGAVAGRVLLAWVY